MSTHGRIPFFLDLTGRVVVVVGGGAVAAAKLDALLRAGARVQVVAPEIQPRIGSLDVRLVRRGFLPEDLDGAWLAVAAAPPEINREVARAAEQRRVWVNAVDDPPAASAFAGGVLRRAGLTIAISTSGQAPAFAGLLREALEAVIPEEIEAWIDEARAQRRSWKAEGVPFERRRPLLLRALNRLYDDRMAGAS
jgi:uroporphyrin-III C-methyltransferase / precorrin-2 dehydrogenase / sirohydrochlorin ferrochelatase